MVCTDGDHFPPCRFGPHRSRRSRLARRRPQYLTQDTLHDFVDFRVVDWAHKICLDYLLVLGMRQAVETAQVTNDRRNIYLFCSFQRSCISGDVASNSFSVPCDSIRPSFKTIILSARRNAARR